MPGATLNISLIQPNVVWENTETNLEHYENLLDTVTGKKEVVVLPEMFSTGFSMSPEKLAEPMTGRAVSWMKSMAAKHRCILTGSLIIEEEGKYYNRMVWVQPDGQTGHYDKRHLFSYAGESECFTPGTSRLITSVKGFRICLMVCYDLRFPVWSRNLGEEYDVLIYAANWPERRRIAWKTLLQARAIENQCYTIGVNRIGKDGNDIQYAGESSVFDPLGELIWQKADEECVHTVTLEMDKITETRDKLPFLHDADKFILL